MKKVKEYFIYITANKRITVFYVGSTDNLVRRIWQHKKKLIDGFTKKYNVDRLLYFESFVTREEAYKREKELKGWIRERKIKLIKEINPEMGDLSKGWWWKEDI